jgi:hypothetical protein
MPLSIGDNILIIPSPETTPIEERVDGDSSSFFVAYSAREEDLKQARDIVCTTLRGYVGLADCEVELVSLERLAQAGRLCIRQIWLSLLLA